MIKRNRRLIPFMVSAILAFFMAGCSNDDNGNTAVPAPVLTIVDLNVAIPENPLANSILESFEVIQENIDAPLQFEIVSQSISGALSVNNQGGLVVANAAVFDFETNTTISGTVQVSSGTISDSASFTISIMDVEEFVPFITTWNLTEDNTTVRLPVFEATGDVETQYDFMVDWGDGTMGDVTSFDDPDTAHTYAASGRYTITITGTLIGFSFGEIPDSKDFFTDVIQWGDLQLGNSGRHFLGCSNLMDFSAMDTPNLSELVNASNMFRDAISFNGSLSSWDVSNITNMGSMFSGAENFNGDISNWDVSNVTDMSFMFFRTSLFNSDISDWNTESLLEMRQMFDQATSFNSDLTNWDVSKVTDMSVLFRNAEAFNGDVSGWDVSSVTNTGGMFFGATAFNRDISGWDVAAVTDMGSMFTRASNFNQNISSWNVGNVTDMSFLFFETENFNSDISGWDVSSVINMSFMFSGAQSFNGDLSSWNVQNVTNMSDMFRFAFNFNRDISGWNVSEVTNMNLMFSFASSFNQNLSGWATDNVIECSNFSEFSALPPENLPVNGPCF